MVLRSSFYEGQFHAYRLIVLALAVRDCKGPSGFSGSFRSSGVCFRVVHESTYSKKSIASSSGHPTMSSLAGRTSSVSSSVIVLIGLLCTMWCSGPTRIRKLDHHKESAEAHIVHIGVRTAAPPHRSPCYRATLFERRIQLSVQFWTSAVKPYEVHSNHAHIVN
jgi:hypothetical protein